MTKEEKEGVAHLEWLLDDGILTREDEKPTKAVLNLIEKQDNKLKHIENHIKAEIKIIEKTYDEVGNKTKTEYDAMMLAYQTLLDIFFKDEGVEEDV